jgi:hypothetical protein
MRVAVWLPKERELSNASNCQILEPCAGKLARTVLRGGSSGNAAPLPDHFQHDPVVQRLRRLGDSQENDGSSPSGITQWSVGVPAAHVRGKDGDRVRFPDGPLEKRAAGPTGRRLVCTQAIGVRFPGGPLDQCGLMVQWEDASAAGWRSALQLPVGPLK